MLLLRSLSVPPAVQFIASELIILIPGFLFLLIYNCDLRKWIPFKKMNGYSIGMTVLFTYLMMPLISFINIFSQLFSENEILGITDEILSIPSLLVVFIIGILGPFCEEFIFRGIIFSGYKKTGRLLGALILSSLLFGLMHMNFNQFCYAGILGFVFALLVEATGSLWSSVISHMIVNTHNVVMLFAVQKLYTALGTDMEQLYGESVTLDEKLYALGLFLILSVIFTSLAAAVFAAICKRQGTAGHIRDIFKSRQENLTGPESRRKKEPLLTFSGVFGIAVCLFVMFGLDPVLRMLGW
ncbi:MAG TPA: CPBP family intramembrane metalloprotease [Lachnospiraceae bacterium]|nr:CPBP family intramembrane metalloprotease [Lachnospiraceae bacterium]